MAKIVEDVLVLKLSKLVKDDAPDSVIANDDIQAALEQVAQELVGDGVIVEIVRA